MLPGGSHAHYHSQTDDAAGSTAAAAHSSFSASTSAGSAGSPSSRSGQAAAATPARENTFLRINRLDIHGGGGDGSSQAAASGKKKKRGTRAVAADKNGRGLRQFSMKVCEKVESKGRTTYNKVADELVAEFADTSSSLATPDQQQYDEKNIRRRVYDALNVLMAMDIISKDKKEIQWKGLLRTSLNDLEQLKAECIALKVRIDKKTAYLQELEDQYVGLRNLVKRNEQLYGSGNVPSGAVALPFILIQTRPHATVEVDISEDMQLVHFDFNRYRAPSYFDNLVKGKSTPFELHDDSYVLKAMRFSEREQTDGTHEPTSKGGECSTTLSMYQQHMPPPRPNTMGRLPTSPPIPGILKTRVKHEH